jgi:hypothetical protein
LNHPEHFLLEREDILERWDHFPGNSEADLKVCDHLLHLPNNGSQDNENGRRNSETFLNRLEMFLRQPEDVLRR